MKKFKPVAGSMFIESVTRPGSEEKSEVNGTLPPSDYYVLDPGDSKYKKGTEVKLRPLAKMIRLEEEVDEFVIEISEVAAYR